MKYKNIKYLYKLLLFLYLFSHISLPGCKGIENSNPNCLFTHGLTEGRKCENIEENDLKRLVKAELKEVLALDWGSEEGQVGYEDSYSKREIATSLGCHYGPSDFFIDSNENIYILDNFNKRVLKFKDQQLCKIYYFDEEAVDYYGKLNIDIKNNLYLVLNYNYKQEVLKYDSKGDFISVYLSERQTVGHRIEVDKEENIYFWTRKNPELDQSLEYIPGYFITRHSKDNRKEDFFIEQSFNGFKVNEQGIIYLLYKDENNTGEIYFFKDNKLNFSFSFYIEDNENLRFLGLDENENLYFYKNLIRIYELSERDKIEGVITGTMDAIIVNQGCLLYKYNSGGDLLKEVKIDDPTPYDIKMNSKGNIYLTPVLATEALLVVPLDKYRIYKFTM